MSARKVIQVSANRNKLLEYCQKFKCTESELNNKVREFLDDYDCGEKPKEEKKPKITLEQKIHNASTVDLRKILNVRKDDDLKKVRQHGLHFKNNVEVYMTQFIDEWFGDPRKITELIAQVRDYQLKEYAALAISERIIEETIDGIKVENQWRFT